MSDANLHGDVRPPLPPLVMRAGKTVVRALAMASAWNRPEPDFVLIGAKRGGTTSLFRYLGEHPNVLPLFPSSRYLPMRGDMKGVHYFDTGFHHGHAWYRSHFPSSIARRRAGRRLGAAVLSGEASPYYLFHPLAPSRAAGELRRTRFIVLLRDPVERTYSHWSEQRRNGIEPLDFEDALAAEASRLAGEAARLSADASAYSFAHEHQSYATQSEYADSLERWFAAFPRERFLVLRSESLYRDPQTTFDTALQFLDLPPHRLGAPVPWNAAARAPLRDSARAALRERFADDQQCVAALLGASAQRPEPSRSDG